MLTRQLPLFDVDAPRSMPKPFLKWAGGKSQLLGQFAAHYPRRFRRYCEPFVGSAAVYWHLYALRAAGELVFGDVCLMDSNVELINCYRVVRDDVSELLAQLANHRKRHKKQYYYSVRAQRVDALSPIERAARFIYLNKTCFNGLYRVNRAGQFNVPMGSYRNPRIFDAEELRAASLALQGVDLEVRDFREVLHWAKEGDFVYFDPPYAPVSRTANFTSYTEKAFGEAEQRELAAVLHKLHRRGCQVMLSNSWIDATLKLYAAFNQHEVKAARVINSKADRRGKVSELLVTNYPI